MIVALTEQLSYVRMHSSWTGAMAEWFKAVVLKTTEGLGSPGVRIPLAPKDMLTTVSLGRCQSGRSGLPAKQLHLSKGAAGSNPVLPAQQDNRTLSEHCPELEPLAVLSAAFVFALRSEQSPHPRILSEISRRYANGVRNSNRMFSSGSIMTRSTI